jgi:pilus assembly protein CpaB
MPLRAAATLSVAILLGLIAAFMTRNYLAAQHVRPGGASASTVAIVVAATPITRGQTLEPAQLKTANYPADAVPVGAFRFVSDLAGPRADRRVAIRTIAVNEPVLADKISDGRMILSTAVAQGMRAVSVRSNDVAGVAGFVLPGDRVDILLTRGGRDAAQGAHGDQVTQVLAENVRVLGVDQTADETADKPQVARAVTVEVTPLQAQAISLAQSVGQISLALRHTADQTPLTRRAITEADLSLGRGRRVGAQTSAQEVRVVRGVEASTYRFP